MPGVTPALGVCQVAAVDDVAIRTWPVLGAVALLTFTTVVAEFNASVLADLPVVSWLNVGKLVRLAALPVVVNNVPEVGNVTFVAPVSVRV